RHLPKDGSRWLRGKEPKDYHHKTLGSVASLGLGRGVADTLGIKLKGWPAWAMHRAYHVKAMPTFNRKVRITMDWLLGGLFRRDILSLGQLHDPHAEFQRASRPD